jgi:hypothetical protein
MFKLATLVILMLGSIIAQAENKLEPRDPYYQISEVTVKVVESSDHHNSSEQDAHIKNYVELNPGTGVGDVIATLRQIIAFGKEVYKIVEAGKPVVNTKYAPISVLPSNTEFGNNITPMDLSYWQPPKFVKFKVSYKNGFGAEVVSFTYNVNMSHGGKFRGTGAFITNAQIVPEKVSVAWGYSFNAEMSLVGLTNMGSDRNPVAGATLQLSYSVSTIIKEDKNNMTIFIAGDGTIKHM